MAQLRACPRTEHAQPLGIGVAVALAEDPVRPPLGDVTRKTGEVPLEVRAPGGPDRRAVARDGESRGVQVLAPRPCGPDGLRAVMALQPLVPDRGSVDLDR